jgi:hypothetical protein
MVPAPDLTRLLLSHPRDPDLWAAVVARTLGRTRGWARHAARTLAVEGDTLPARCHAVWSDTYGPSIGIL